MKTLAVFIHFDGTNNIKPYVKYYIDKLLEIFDNVLVVTNLTEFNNSYFSTSMNVDIMSFRNTGYDFGMFFKALNSIDLTQYERIGFFNDSNILFKQLKDIFKLGLKLKKDFWGITDSYEGLPDMDKKYTYHIQSHFLIFEKKAIDLILPFFESINFIELLNEKTVGRELRLKIIANCEIGLSQFYLKHNLDIGSVYSSLEFIPKYSSRNYTNTNIHIWLWKELIENKYPFIKKKIVINGFDPIYEPKSSLPSFLNWEKMVMNHSDIDALQNKILKML